MPLFEVCIIQKPTKKAAEDGELEVLIVKPQLIVARDTQAAGFEAVFSAASQLPEDRTRLEVLVRPFA